MNWLNKKYVILLTMKKEILVLIAIVAVGVILFLGAGASEKERGASRDLSSTIKSFSLFGDNLKNSETASAVAWESFDAYMEAAKTHNLETLRGLSYKLSPACLDSAREEECFALMDSVYTIASSLDKSGFRHIEFDRKQIVMWTDGPGVAILYFTREGREKPKILGLQFCLELEEGDPCVKQELLKNDENGNGWWDRVEELINEPAPASQ